VRRTLSVLFVALATLVALVQPTGPSTATSRAAKKPALVVTPAQPLQGTNATFKTKLPTRVKRPAVLQRQVGRTWVKVEKARSNRRGKVVFRNVFVASDARWRVKARSIRSGGTRLPAVLSAARRIRPTPRAELVSVAPNGRSTAEEAAFAGVSGDGRYVVFHSSATTLVPGAVYPAPGMTQVFVRDRLVGATTLVSAASPGVAGNSVSLRPVISRDGRYVAFASYADDLVAGDANDRQDIFRWDRVTGDIVKVTASGLGGGTDEDSYDPSISADGQRITYSTEATNVDTDDDNGFADMYVWEAGSGLAERVSVDTTGGDPNGSSEAGVLSADGTHLVFTSTASDLVVDDTNGVRDVFRRNLVDDTTVLVSQPPVGVANALSGQGTVSADGRYVAFSSAADNLVAGGSPDNGTTNAFVRDMITGTTVLVSKDRLSGPTDAFSYPPTSVSDDGRLVVFSSLASDLVAGDTNAQPDAFVWDRATGTVGLAVRDAGWGHPNGAVYEPILSADGRWIAFYSTATDLLPSDTTAEVDVYVWRR
jgi:Tol biopolymer transport system component